MVRSTGAGFVRVLWPDGPRWVHEARILLWAEDAWANRTVWRCSECHAITMHPENGALALGCDCAATEEPEGGEGPPTTLADAAELLSDLGLVTFARAG